jgi:peptidoglycan hydrolase CwlO-like protein
MFNKLRVFLQFVLVLLVVAGFQFKTGSIFLSSFNPISQAYADEVDELQKQIDELEKLKRLSEDATKPLEAEVNSLDNRIASARNSISVAKKEAIELSTQIKKRESDLTIQYQIFSRRVTQQYKRLRTYSPIVMVLASDSASDLSKDLAYRESVKQQDNQFIKAIGEDIKGLQEDKKRLEDNQIQLASLEKQLDSQASFFKVEISKAKNYQSELTGQIAEVSARQQEIINARSGGFTASIGDIELADDYKASIKGFREEAPSGYFAIFSFGAYSHRKGMSQYGARGRAESGQDFKEILKEYYGKEPVDKSGDTSGNIKVSGYPDMDFESTYLYGIAEMPSSWHIEALKAQAVAARTFALRYKKEGSTICTTESCQVFNKSKSDNVPESWKKAVKDTKGQVLEDVTTFYASTHGGWSTTGGWDTTDGGGGSNFIDKAYENIGGSPWLYKSWWRAGYTKSGSTCGRSDPWLSPEEMADIVNAHLVLTKGNSGETEKISPVTTECWGGNPYSVSELRDVASRYGGISSANSVSVSLGDGRTNSVKIGGVSMSGDQFCNAFNLRAPGNMRIPQWSGNSCNGAFFNIERK